VIKNEVEAVPEKGIVKEEEKDLAVEKETEVTSEKETEGTNVKETEVMNEKETEVMTEIEAEVATETEIEGLVQVVDSVMKARAEESVALPEKEEDLQETKKMEWLLISEAHQFPWKMLLPEMQEPCLLIIFLSKLMNEISRLFSRKLEV
jgi:hypothetical protein